jgi:hypothetical protein
MNTKLKTNREIFALILTTAVRLNRIDLFEQNLLDSEREVRQSLSLASPDVLRKLKEDFPEVFEWLDEQQNV